MRKILILLGACIVLLLGGYAGYRGYSVWKQSHLISLARTFIAKGDQRNALLSIKQVLLANPRNIDACRFMADLAEASHYPSVIMWRSRVVEMAPHSTADRIALVRVAAAAGDLALATNSLAEVSDSGKQTSLYHNTAGMIAAMTGKLAEAESHFIEASRLEPTNPVPRLNLAVVQLQQTNSPAPAQGRATLLQLRTTPGVDCLALRELIKDALRTGRVNDALSYCSELVKDTNSVYSDQVLRLEVLHTSRPAEFKTALATAQREAASTPGHIYQLASWQLTRSGAAETIKWLKTLPRDIQTNQPTALLIANCQLELHDWRGLQQFIEPQNWAETEFLRGALLARALREQNMLDSSKAMWDQAVRTVNGQRIGLTSLLRLAGEWKWQTEAEELLWTIVDRYPGERWAADALTRALYLGGRTRSLMAFYNQQTKRRPDDLSARNNLAMTALLLDAREYNPHQLAQEVYQKSPTNSSFISTYAFSLYQRGKNAEALQLIEKLPQKELQDPSVAGYYGLILKATGHQAKARTYLEKSSRGTLLPEERKLFERAL
jgi:Flp pilus assembly protein TadD